MAPSLLATSTSSSTYPFESQINSNLMTHMPLQRHGQLELVEQVSLARPSITCTTADQKKLLLKTEQDLLG
jgi:hypothetical protein